MTKEPMPTAHERPSQDGLDFVELQVDVSASPLWNKDLAPTTIRERTWSTWNIAALWIGMSVVITTYTLAGGFIEAGMNWWQAMATILAGNTIVLVPMILNAHAGTKYGVSFPVLCRAAFGTRGANVPALLRAIVACGWFGIQTWIGGAAIDALLAGAWRGWESLFGGASLMGVAAHTWIASAFFWAIQVAIILKGIEGIKFLESWSAPLLLLGGAALLAWAASRAGGLGRVLAESSALQRQHQHFWTIFPGALTASVGYWATLSLNIPDFTRYARSQRSQILGQALGLPLTMTAFAFIGVAVTSATVLIYGTAIPDPVELMKRFDSLAVLLFATLVIFAAQISTNMAANVVSPSNDFSNLNPRLISYLGGGLITAGIGILMMPWKLLASMGNYIFTWLIGYSGLMGAIAGILICDYWVLRRQRLDLPALFDPHGRYAYSNGFNWRAILALALAIAPVVPGFLRAASTPGGQIALPGFLDTLYTYSWFVTFLLGFILHFLLMRKTVKE
ncbi:MAG: NCS1 family nucleobase:cation symporter-1 [Blastocatellia bacterium]|nr:NCS1 family nucleobase:cation symporter-1 [Blastocatellia bacterium]